jgi:uncharacterized protein YkwD
MFRSSGCAIVLFALFFFVPPGFAMGQGPGSAPPAVESPDPSALLPDLPPQSEQIVRMEEEVRQRINKERAAHGLEPLSANAELARVARAFSRQMSEEGFFSHTDPAGRGMVDRLRAAGIRYRVSGENISMNINAPDPVDLAVRGWMKSPGHRDNILRGAFTETGIGIWRDGETYHFTQLFIRPF